MFLYFFTEGVPKYGIQYVNEQAELQLTPQKAVNAGDYSQVALIQIKVPVTEHLT